MENKINTILIIFVLIATLNYGLVALLNFDIFQTINNKTFDSALLLKMFYIFLGATPLILLYYAQN